VTDNANTTLSAAVTTTAGEQTIMANYAGSTITDNVTLTVAPAITSITVESAIATYNNNAASEQFSYQFKAYAEFANGERQDITEQVLWQSSGTGIERVSNVEGKKGLVTPSTDVGSATVSAQLFSHTGLVVEGIKGITIADSTVRILDSIAITGDASLGNSAIVPFTAMATYTTAPTSIDVTEQVTWSYDGTNGSITNVSDLRGEFIATDAGTETADVTATMPLATAVTGSLEIDKTLEDAIGLSLSTVIPILVVDSSQQLAVDLVFSTADNIDYTDKVVWISSDPSKVFISNAPESKGLIKRIAGGDITITAVYGLLSSTPVTISEP